MDPVSVGTRVRIAADNEWKGMAGVVCEIKEKHGGCIVQHDTGPTGGWGWSELELETPLWVRNPNSAKWSRADGVFFQPYGSTVPGQSGWYVLLPDGRNHFLGVETHRTEDALKLMRLIDETWAYPYKSPPGKLALLMTPP